MVTINGYSCVECSWDYVSNMGDRVTAVTRHRLAHLLEGIGWTVGLKVEVERILMAEVNPREMLSKNALEREKRRRSGTLTWRVFTERIGEWWPLTTHKIGEAKAVDAVIEPLAGGRWYERGEDGSTCDWGRVLAFEPHTRLVLSWEVSADWKHDPNLQTEVEVRFISEDDGSTRVELEHRHLDRYAERSDQMRTIFDSEAGWSGLLQAYASLATSGSG